MEKETKSLKMMTVLFDRVKMREETTREVFTNILCRIKNSV